VGREGSWWGHKRLSFGGTLAVGLSNQHQMRKTPGVGNKKRIGPVLERRRIRLKQDQVVGGHVKEPVGKGNIKVVFAGRNQVRRTGIWDQAHTAVRKLRWGKIRAPVCVEEGEKLYVDKRPARGRVRGT